MGFLCWWSNHWFLSFLLLSIIITQISNVSGIETGTPGLFAVILLQCIIVAGIRSYKGTECLKEERNNIARKLKMAEAQLD
jgi:hypothetical protein